ncbi:TlpA disulfide reductase family protein [Polaribacter sp. KT25b]|uniref:TlpA family protein disulfide reductase n=1 Tax=Polaribacter sp. KT25b TaxID=1855336 RepID=UPI0012FD649B|nr:TlpA disulfide reductase family protein [Polaribacter sp. KT25b]
MIYSMSLLTLIWGIHFFRESSIIVNIIIYFIFTPLTFYLGYYLKNKHVFYKIIYPVFLVLIGVYGFTNLWYYTTNFNSRVNYNSPIMNFHNNEVRIDTIKNEVIVLDYWTTSCGVCFKKFPEFEKLYLKYKENPNVKLYAVNIPIKRDTFGSAKKMIEKYNYQFPVLYSDSDTIPKQLGFNKYPHLIILKNGKVRYNGYPALGEDNLFVNSLDDEIELLLKE